ncbi:hypothetical protein ACQ86N_07955 [Puia sp. P3]|uniref:hypothetical protein n=1 Tax=Puia sp. P3 TaxID=3423952 RepID=UPI003D66BD32
MKPLVEFDVAVFCRHRGDSIRIPVQVDQEDPQEAESDVGLLVTHMLIFAP